MLESERRWNIPISPLSSGPKWGEEWTFGWRSQSSHVLNDHSTSSSTLEPALERSQSPISALALRFISLLALMVAGKASTASMEDGDSSNSRVGVAGVGNGMLLS